MTYFRPVRVTDHGADSPLTPASAAALVPMIIDLFAPSSVVDIGCGMGLWVREFTRRGTYALGVDGADSSDLADQYLQVDLRNERLDLDTHFDLALCLEVAEHLPPSRAHDLVEDLSNLADTVIFSAAIPGQGGPSHINEQWQSYWADLFSKQGMTTHDLLRPMIWGDERVAYWYQQNTLVYARPGRFAPSASILDVVHPLLAAAGLNSRPLLLTELPSAVRDSIVASLKSRAKKRQILDQ